MKKTIAFGGACLILAFSLLASGVVLAKNGKGHTSAHEPSEHSAQGSQDFHKGEGLEHGGDSTWGRIGDDDRLIIKKYVAKEHRAHCPPGLAKKHPHCLPPGQAKKYARGDILPEDVIWQPIPDDLFGRLRPPPPGARYVRVDNDVLLVTEATRKILDAVTLLSAVK